MRAAFSAFRAFRLGVAPPHRTTPSVGIFVSRFGLVTLTPDLIVVSAPPVDTGGLIYTTDTVTLLCQTRPAPTFVVTDDGVMTMECQPINGPGASPTLYQLATVDCCPSSL